MTPKNRQLTRWLVKEAAWTAGKILNFWHQENMIEIDQP